MPESVRPLNTPGMRWQSVVQCFVGVNSQGTRDQSSVNIMTLELQNLVSSICFWVEGGNKLRDCLMKSQFGKSAHGFILRSGGTWYRDTIKLPEDHKINPCANLSH